MFVGISLAVRSQSDPVRSKYWIISTHLRVSMTHGVKPSGATSLSLRTSDIPHAFFLCAQDQNYSTLQSTMHTANILLLTGALLPQASSSPSQLFGLSSLDNQPGFLSQLLPL